MYKVAIESYNREQSASKDFQKKICGDGPWKECKNVESNATIYKLIMYNVPCFKFNVPKDK